MHDNRVQVVYVGDFGRRVWQGSAPDIDYCDEGLLPAKLLECPARDADTALHRARNRYRRAPALERQPALALLVLSLSEPAAIGLGIAVAESAHTQGTDVVVLVDRVSSSTPTESLALQCFAAECSAIIAASDLCGEDSPRLAVGRALTTLLGVAECGIMGLSVDELRSFLVTEKRLARFGHAQGDTPGVALEAFRKLPWRAREFAPFYLVRMAGRSSALLRHMQPGLAALWEQAPCRMAFTVVVEEQAAPDTVTVGIVAFGAGDVHRDVR